MLLKYGYRNPTGFRQWVVHFPKSLKTIGDRAFFGCGNLKEITLPEGFEAIYDQVFAGCKSLEEVTIPEYVEIGYRAFDDTLRKRRTF